MQYVTEPFNLPSLYCISDVSSLYDSMQHLIFHPIGPISPLYFSPAKFLQIFKLLTFSKSVQILVLYKAMCQTQLFIKSERSRLVDVRFCRGNPRLDLKCAFSSRAIMLPIALKCYTLFICFSSTIFRTGEGCLEILITLNFPNSFPFQSIFQFQSVYK